MVRPGLFERPTFCSGGNAARLILLILSVTTTLLILYSDGLSEKLLGKLLGKFPVSQSLSIWGSRESRHPEPVRQRRCFLIGCVVKLNSPAYRFRVL